MNYEFSITLEVRRMSNEETSGVTSPYITEAFVKVRAPLFLLPVGVTLSDMLPVTNSKLQTYCTRCYQYSLMFHTERRHFLIVTNLFFAITTFMEDEWFCMRILFEMIN